MNSKELYDLLRNAEYDAHPSWRHLVTTHWVMDLDWYKEIRRAFLQPVCDDDGDAVRKAKEEAADESKWKPDPGDMVLGYTITVTDDGGTPHLVDSRPDAEFRQQAAKNIMEPFLEALALAELAGDE